jgi:hypothetical protein
MNKAMRAFAAVSMFGLLGCATGARSKTESVIAPGADIAAFASFGWQSAGESPGAGNPPRSIADANIQNAIRAQLVEGCEVEHAPDLLIS